MSMLESSQDNRRGNNDTDRPGQRDAEDGGTRSLGFAPHDDFRVASRKPGLAIFEYEEGESI